MCKELGVIHPDYLQDNLTAKQISEWEAFNRLEPIGEWRQDYRMAFIASIMINIARAMSGAKGVKMTTPADYMPVWYTDPNEPDEPMQQSLEDMKKVLLELGSIKFGERTKPKPKK